MSALDGGDPQALCEELGDLLIQVGLHAQIAAEEGDFTMADVLRRVHEKLVRRHPHVFGDLRVADAKEVKRNWEALKEAERMAKGQNVAGALAGVASTLPALAQADAYQKRAARVGFDWTDVQGVLAKVREELAEVQRAPDPQARAREIGDLLFAVANLARWYEVDAESALREANARFRERFTHVEGLVRAQGRSLREMTLAEMDALWGKAKRGEF